jgi:hypothetical protein
MVNRLAIRSVVVAAVENLVLEAAQRCADQRLMLKSLNVAKGVSAMVAQSVGTRCVYKFVTESLK